MAGTSRRRLIIALAIGAVIGASNAFLVVRLGINAFIVTLASYIWVRGLVVALSGGRSVYGLPNSMRLVAVAHVSDIPVLGGIPLLGEVPVLGLTVMLVFVSSPSSSTRRPSAAT